MLDGVSDGSPSPPSLPPKGRRRKKYNSCPSWGNEVVSLTCQACKILIGDRPVLRCMKGLLTHQKILFPLTPPLALLGERGAP